MTTPHPTKSAPAPAAVAGPNETVKFPDQSTADPVEKARRYLKAMGGQRTNSAYFFDDGYPRREIAQGALATLAVLEQLAAAPTAQAAPAAAAPEYPQMPEMWHVDAHVHGEKILSIGYDWLSGKGDLTESEEQAVVGMAQHLLSFVGYGLPQSGFDPDADEQATAAQGDALDQGVREELSIGKAINRAARDLPEGWEIRIDLERHAGVVFLIDPDGNETMSEGGELFSDQINAAIDAARAAKEGGEA